MAAKPPKSSGRRSPATTRRLQTLTRRSGRSSGARLAIEFARSDGETPLVRLLRGGQGGEVRLKLYLTMATLATKYPYKINQPTPTASVWAETLGLPNPTTSGARRINDAIAWLDENGFIKADRRQGRPPVIEVFRPQATPHWSSKGRWISVPIELWQNEWIVELSGSAIALFIVLLELTNGRKGATPMYATSVRRVDYGLSDDTWTRAGAELEQAGLLTIGTKTAAEGYDVRRRRNTYLLNFDRLARDPDYRGTDSQSLG